MADIETLLGMGLGPEADMKALAAQLRGQQQLGNVLSLSTIAQASDMGKAKRKSAESAAKSGGVLKQARAKLDAAKARDAEAIRQFGLTEARKAAENERGVTEFDRTAARLEGADAQGIAEYDQTETRLDAARQAQVSQNAAMEDRLGAGQDLQSERDAFAEQREANRLAEVDATKDAADAKLKVEAKQRKEAARRWDITSNRGTRELILKEEAADQKSKDFKYVEFSDPSGTVHGVYKNPDKNRYENMAGEAVDPSKEGWSLRQKKGTRGLVANRSKMDGVDIITHTDPYTGASEGPKIAATGEPATPENLKKYREGSLDYKKDTAFSTESGKQQGVQVDEMRESIGGMRMVMGKLKEGVNAIDSGAWTGAFVSKYLPTLTAATARLENAQAALGLGVISEYTLTPVSDKDMGLALRVGLNMYQDPGDLRRALIHKYEVTDRTMKAHQYIIDTINSRKEVDREYVTDILYGKDRKFSFAPPPLKGEIAQPDWAPDSWWTLTPEQKRQAIAGKDAEAPKAQAP